jgi:replication factor A2
VGKVISVNEEQVTAKLVVDDGTGRLTAQMFLHGDDADIERQRLAELTPGKYVRLFGHMNGYGKELSAFSARPITDHNEVTYHLSQIIFQDLHLSKGGSDNFGMAAMPDMNSGAPIGGFGAAAPAAAAFGASGLNPIQDDVLKIFNAPDAMNIEAGLTAHDIIARSNNRYNKGQVDDAIQYLVNDGHLYSTIDDQHYKSCNT